MELLKMIIADDEPIVRAGILSMIPMEELGLTLVGECRNGEDIIRITEENNGDVDILLTDTKMPVIDGLEAAEWMHKHYPSCAIIFFSGFAEYDLLRAAMQYKAVDYLLKPVQRDNLLKSLNSVISVVRSRKQESRRVTWRSSEAKILRNYAQSRIPYEDIAEFEHLCPYFVASLKANPASNGIEPIAMSLREAFPGMLISRDEKSPHESLFCFIPSKSVTEVQLLDWAKGNKCGLVMGLSLEKTDIKYLPQAYQQAHKALLDAAKEGDLYHKFVDNNQNNVVVGLMIYVSEKYREPITLDKAAFDLSYNASYASRIFKKHVGCSFTTYLTQYRVSIAKAIISRNPTGKISEIAEETGFTDVSYFIKIFKKIVGETPFQYKHHFLGVDQ